MSNFLFAMKQSVVFLCVAFLMLMLFGVDASWAKSPKSGRVVATHSGAQSTQQVYNSLLEEQSQIGEQISNLSLQLHSVSPSKGKKISHQINLLNDELVVVERKLAAFPSKYTGAINPAATDGAATDDAFRKQLDSLATLRVAESNPFSGQLSADPELDKMYRAYLKMYGDGATITQQTAVLTNPSRSIVESKEVVYRVMVAISKVRLSTSEFVGIPDVVEQTMPVGGYAYYSGQYSSIGQAQGACDQILAHHKFRDAFVVAMEGGRRVPIKK